MGGVCSREEERRIKVLVGKPVVKGPLERPRRRREGSMKMGFQEVGWGSRNGLIWLRIWTGGGLL